MTRIKIMGMAVLVLGLVVLAIEVGRGFALPASLV